jgi:hypothetical protein
MAVITESYATGSGCREVRIGGIRSRPRSRGCLGGGPSAGPGGAPGVRACRFDPAAGPGAVARCKRPGARAQSPDGAEGRPSDRTSPLRGSVAAAVGGGAGGKRRWGACGSGCGVRARNAAVAATVRGSEMRRWQRQCGGWFCSRLRAPDVAEFRHHRDLTHLDVREFRLHPEPDPFSRCRPDQSFTQGDRRL